MRMKKRHNPKNHDTLFSTITLVLQLALQQLDPKSSYCSHQIIRYTGIYLSMKKSPPPRRDAVVLNSGDVLIAGLQSSAIFYFCNQALGIKLPQINKAVAFGATASYALSEGSNTEALSAATLALSLLASYWDPTKSTNPHNLLLPVAYILLSHAKRIEQLCSHIADRQNTIANPFSRLTVKTLATLLAGLYLLIEPSYIVSSLSIATYGIFYLCRSAVEQQPGLNLLLLMTLMTAQTFLPILFTASKQETNPIPKHSSTACKDAMLGACEAIRPLDPSCRPLVEQALENPSNASCYRRIKSFLHPDHYPQDTQIAEEWFTSVTGTCGERRINTKP